MDCGYHIVKNATADPAEAIPPEDVLHKTAKHAVIPGRRPTGSALRARGQAPAVNPDSMNIERGVHGFRIGSLRSAPE